MKKLILLFFSLLIIVVAQGQRIPGNLSPNRVQAINAEVENARAIIKEKGLSEDEVIQRMQDKGIDLQNLDPTTADPDKIRSVFNEVVEELTEEQAKAGTESSDSTVTTTSTSVTTGIGADQTKNIENKVNQGKTVSEAIAEEVAEEIQEDLPPTDIYGQHIFRNNSIAEFTKSYEVKPPLTYQLGVGDQVAVSLFGISLFNGKFEIGTDGFIRPENMSPIYLKNITLEKAKPLIASRFHQRYRFTDDQIEVTLDVARTITVNIVGDVINPGAYTIPATNTAINALAIAGGPSNIGSVRNIELIKQNGERRKIDIYEYLQNPNKANEFFLEQNDFIYVPVARKIVSIDGAIQRSFRYELLENENLKSLIDYAGGLAANAYRSNIQVRRLVDDEERLLDINLKTLYDENKDFALSNADQIIVRSIPKPYQNFVEAGGAVQLSGKYELIPNMRITDLVNKAILDKEARTDVMYLKRVKPDRNVEYIRLNYDSIQLNPAGTLNLLLQPEDYLQVYTLSKFADKGTIQVEGAVRSPVEVPFDLEDNLKLQDALLLAGGLNKDASDFGYLFRKNSSNSEDIIYQRINVREATNAGNSSSNILLQPNDRILVLSNTQFSDEFTIAVQGEVRRPGEYQYDETLTLRDALTLAGGLKLEAASNQVEVFRLLMDNNQPTQTIVAQVEVDDNLNIISGGDFPLAPFDLVVVRRVPDFELFQVITLDGEVKFPGVYPLIDDNERLLSVINRAGGLTNEAFPSGATLFRTTDKVGLVVMDLEAVMKNANSRFNFILKTGDIISIPKQQDLVAIRGAIKAYELYPEQYLTTGAINVAYHNRKRAMFYINEYAAGISDNGKRSLITVEHPNGRIERTTDLGIVKIYPKVDKGAIISVGFKPVKPEEERQQVEEEPINWSEVVRDTLAQVTTILSLVLLVQRISN